MGSRGCGCFFRCSVRRHAKDMGEDRRVQDVPGAPFFRGWARPGLVPPGVATYPGPLDEGETLDAISGHFRLYQLRKGHRFSTDDVILAWYGTSWGGSVASVLDLGSGVGSVAMVAAWRLTGARFVTVEAQSESVALARKSAEYNGLLSRFEIRLGDFRESGVVAQDEKFDLIFGSPPYFPLGSGVHGDHPQKIACRFEARGGIEDYCKTAAKHLALGGWFACVFPHEQIARVEAAATASGLRIVRKRSVIARESEPPLLVLFAMVRREHLPVEAPECWEEPPLTVRKADGSVHPEYAVIKLSFGFPP